MEYVIGIILFIIALIIIGFFVKKKYYSVIDRLESWKIEVMNRPVLDEVGKIKQLNMSGQAEEFFERWRKTWDSVVTVELPNVEEWLFDAEEYVDKFRFNKAKEVFLQIETTLKQAEAKIDEMVVKLNELIGSEEKNREDILELQELFKTMKKNLLAHRHAYGKAAGPLEEKLLNTNNLFAGFEESTNAGNYLIAREIVLQLREELTIIHERLEKIPFLLNETQNIIPTSLREIKDGIKEMTESGYQLDHLGIEKEMERLEKQLVSYRELIAKTEIHEVVEGIDDMKDSLDIMYDLLEKEVDAKKFVTENSQEVQNSVTKLLTTHEHLQNEVNMVKMSYHLSHADEEILEEMNKQVESLKNSLAIIFLQNEDKALNAYSVIKEKLEVMIAEITELDKEQQRYMEMLNDLRKDEIDARGKILELKMKVQETTRLVNRSNVPGIPNNVEILFLETGEAVQECYRYLDEKPLSMPAVREALNKAETNVEKLYKQVEEMIENVYFVERIIQYGNRYRRDYQHIDERLSNAEEAFRRFDYHLALEEAAAAVESVEPGALKRIESILNEEMKQTV
ncbi:septation ring formation regulator EzrA [Caldibacillus lycopersici]|uniref:Septation ring formation regulator EzrA n=1 Tax=Perspicuibacillus lycopersici TaxID=1325689 RepID=A0AAE3IY72_9BACI|nr:septation ring formation regulator EzrA [Perspicuibacillus lycopersici]MCU9614220.1 septation ring formation regulator EzrA [Perspicuibacillus lycopersici]